MSPPDLGIGEQSECNGLKERNYFDLCDCSSVDSSVVPEENKGSLNLKATELRLGLPGSQSPEHDSDENGICPLLQKSIVSGNKRSLPEGSWIFSTTGSESGQPNLSCNVWSNSDLKALPKSSQDCSNKQNCSTARGNAALPAAKAQMVGWPPVRLPRKNTLVTNSKRNDEVECKPGGGDGLFVKVSMDGAPYLRKVDLRMHHAYQDLSFALEKMFDCFIAAQGIPNGSEILKSNDVHGSEYVLTYEDKDGDWMLVGDVPWEMFIGSCKRLKIMKGCDAIGLAPGVVEKMKSLK